MCMMAAQDKAEQVVEAARNWLGTPFRHRASVKGAGADCLGLVRGVWRDCQGAEPLRVPIYTVGWFEDGPNDVMADAFGAVFHKVADHTAAPGDVVLFRFRVGAICKHAGILSGRVGALRFIHAYSRRGVVETSFDAAWRRRVAGFYRFPARSS